MSVRRTRLFLTAVGAALLVAVSGCAADSNDSSAPSSADRGVAAPGVAQENGAAGAGPAPAKEPNQDPNKVPDKVPDNLDVENRSIIYAGTMTVRVDNVDDAAAKAISFATQAGGFVGGDNRRRDDRRSTGTLVLRIPAAKFTPTLDLLKGLGDEEDRTITAQDVTDQVVDVQARLDNASASVDRIRALLAKATTIGEITSLESELSRRLSDLESLQARKRKLDGLTALSTITLQLLGPEAALAPDKDETGAAAGFKHGLKAFLSSLQVALTVLGWLTPWILLLGVPVYVIMWLVRRFRPKRPAPAPAPAPVLVPAGATIGGPQQGWNPPAYPAAQRQMPVARPGAVPPARGPVSAPPAAPQAGPVSAPPAVTAPEAGPVSAPPAGGPGDGDGAGPVPAPPAGGRGPGSATPPATSGPLVKRDEDDPKDR